MKQFHEILETISSAAKAHGFNAGYEPGDRLPRITASGNAGYVNISLLDVPDFPMCDFASGRFEGRIEVTASVSRMGGNPTPEELLNAAEQIREAALLVRELQSADLGYSEIRKGL